MNARLLLNVGLLLLCAILGWFALRPETPEPTPPTRALTTLTAEQISRIRIERNGSTVAQLQRNDDGWRIQTPIDAAADAFRVQTLIGLAVARSEVGFRAAGNDLTQFGLQPAQAVVRFNDTALQIGISNPIDGQRYVLSDGEVHLLDDNWFSPIFGPGIAWLDPRLLPDNAVPEAIELHFESGVTVRWQLIDSKWQRTPATSDAATMATRGRALADAWRQARALSVQQRAAGLTWNARARVSFKRSAPPTAVTNTETIEFVLARTKDALFIAREDLNVQYRFLARQGPALLDAREEPKP